MQVDGLTIKYQPVNCVEVEFKVLAEVGKKNFRVDIYVKTK